MGILSMIKKKRWAFLFVRLIEVGRLKRLPFSWAKKCPSPFVLYEHKVSIRYEKAPVYAEKRI